VNWKLNSEVFKVLNHSFSPFTEDLFVNRINTQLERFYRYLPDPLAEQYDALVQPWREENAYPFPPFNLISKCLRKISLQGATLWIICPVWPAQAWYPHLLQLLTVNPVLLPSQSNLLLDPLKLCHGGTALIHAHSNDSPCTQADFQSKNALASKFERQISYPHCLFDFLYLFKFIYFLKGIRL